jgi:hypothetical protein
MEASDQKDDTGTVEEQHKEARYTERDLSLRPVPAVYIAIRDINVTLHGGHAVKASSFFSRRRKARDGIEELGPRTTDKKILNGISADFPSGSLTGKALYTTLVTWLPADTNPSYSR